MSTETEQVTFCEHGVSHQPGQPIGHGKSVWCGECFPDPSQIDAAIEAEGSEDDAE